MKKVLALLIGLAAVPAFAAGNLTTGTTTGISGSGLNFSGNAQASFGTHLVTLNVGGGNPPSLTAAKQPDQGSNTTAVSSVGLSVGAALGGGFGNTGGTAGTTAGSLGFAPPAGF